MPRNKVAPQHTTAQRELRKLSLYRGIVARTARQLGLSRSHVFRVSMGTRRSKRVEDALARELRIAEKLARKAVA